MCVCDHFKRTAQGIDVEETFAFVTLVVLLRSGCRNPKHVKIVSTCMLCQLRRLYQFQQLDANDVRSNT